MKEKEKQMLVNRYGRNRLAEKLSQPLDTEIRDFEPDREELDFGSTDVGDVGFIAPTITSRRLRKPLGRRAIPGTRLDR
jgi:aminobenzoyl-glutamate utilization protein B